MRTLASSQAALMGLGGCTLSKERGFAFGAVKPALEEIGLHLFALQPLRPCWGRPACTPEPECNLTLAETTRACYLRRVGSAQAVVGA